MPRQLHRMERAGPEGYWKQEMIDQSMVFHHLNSPRGLVYLSSTTKSSIIDCGPGVLPSGRLCKSRMDRHSVRQSTIPGQMTHH